jgi:hypothetical protein
MAEKVLILPAKLKKYPKVKPEERSGTFSVG